MSEHSTNLKLPYILPSQAQKHVTCNEAFRILDALAQLCVLDYKILVPPASPVEGDRYIIPENASEAWKGHENKIAAWQDGAWGFYDPKSGWVSWIVRERRLIVFDGDSWSFPNFQNLEMVGIHAVADTVNRLVVRSEASLFDHTGHGHQHKINKATARDTASLLFQTNYSGRAEIGLIGNDLLKFNLSADGKNWTEGLVLDSVRGNVGIGSSPAARLHVQGKTVSEAEIRSQTKSNSSSSGGSLALQHNDAHSSMPKAQDRLGSIAFGTEQRQGQGFYGAKLCAYAEDDYLAERSAPTRLSFQTASQGSQDLKERLVIKSDGKIGIGTRDPKALLDVSGVLRIGQFLQSSLPAASDFGSGSLIYVDSSAGNTPPYIAFSDGVHWRRVSNSTIIN